MCSGGESMSEWIISSSALIVAMVLLRRVMRGKISLRLQYALWLIVLVRLLLPLSFGEARVSVQNVVREADAKLTSQVLTYVNYETPDLSIPEPDQNLGEAERQAQYEQNLAEYEAQIEAAKAETGTPVTLSDVLRSVWYAGMALMGLWFLATNLVFRARLRRGRERVEYACPPPVYVTDAVETPCLFGSAIYVTREAAEDPVALRHSVEHELTHRRHGDQLWAILRCLCLVLHWYNPLVWLAASLSRRDAELACDEATIKRLGEDERAAYGRTLIGIACEKRATLLRTATTMNCGKAGLRERILLIAKKPKTAVYAVIILIIAAVAITGCTFTGAQKEVTGPDDTGTVVPSDDAAPSPSEEWTSEPAEGKVSLGVTLTGLSPETPAWYAPEAQDEWRALLDEAIARAQTGTHVSEGANLLGQRITDGGRELYFNTDGSLCSLDENYLISAADAAPLRALMDETLSDLGVSGHVQPADIRGLRSAAFEFFGGTATLTDEAALAEIERILSASTSTYPSQCGFASVMRLEREDGEVLSLGMAGDGCGAWQSNGWFYSYTGDNFDLYSLFAAQLIHDLDTETLFGGYYGGALLKYLDWQRCCDLYGEDGALALLDRLFDAAMTDEAVRGGLLMYLPAPEGALAEHYAARLAELQEQSAEYTPEPWPEFLAGPAEGGYEFRSEELGLTFTVPAEVSQKVAVASGVKYNDPDGTSITLYYVPENGRYPFTMFYMVAESPRGDFFRPDSWYYSTSTGHPIAAMSENSVYFTMGPLGGSEIGRDDPLWDDFIETSTAVSAAIRETIVVDDPSSIPELDTAAVSSAADELAARGDPALTRAEAAQLAFGLLSAENKAEAYPLDYTDVEPSGDAAQAIAYLASYGLLTRYSMDGEDLDGGLFRPDEDITRAEFVTLLHRLSLKPCPLAYGKMLENVGIDYWACSYVDYAWKCGWLELTDGDIRADEPIICAEAAQALKCVAENGYPIPGVDF